MTQSPKMRKNQGLSGDMFVEAFNNATYPSTGLTSDPCPTPEHTGNEVESPTSSAEDIANAQGAAQTPRNKATYRTGESSIPVRLNPRSCVTCRKRKVRCDKHEPCSNCVKAAIECHFPPPGRAPRKPRRPHDGELLKRLRRLESVVDSLGAQVDDDGHVHEGGTHRRNASGSHGEASLNSDGRRISLELGVGKLMIKDGRSRYISNQFWSSLGEELADIRSVLHTTSSDDEEDPPTPETANGPPYRHADHQGFVFGYSSLMFDMTKLHPSPSQIFIMWEIFKENIDPVMKILHVPTAKNVIMKAAVSVNSLSKASEALFYSICFASVVSMTEDQCTQLLGDDKDALMYKYRFAVEQALARASFLNSGNLMILQAFVLFLTIVKYMDTSRSIWILSGLAMQQAQAQGLHRDGTNFKLPPFDTEMRRRLWWHISLQDARASEEHGADPALHNHIFDTRMPLNVNDEDIWPEMTEAPKQHVGATDMTFCLIRFELAHIQRRLRILVCGETDEHRMNNVEEKEQLIDITHRRMQDKYFSHCDPNIPFLWVASTVGKLILAKMWLSVHHPRLQESDSPATQTLKDQIFITSVEVVEFGIVLERGKETSKWAWLFRTYMQWHAIAFVLSELCIRSIGSDYERAWSAVEAVYDARMIDVHKSQRGMFWRPLKQLYARAKARRDQLYGVSPESEAEASRSVGSDTQGTPRTKGDLTEGNWLTAIPFGNAVSTSGNAFGLDFNDVAFAEENVANVHDVGGSSLGFNQQYSTLRNPVDGFAAGWIPDLGDYMSDFTAPNQQSGWTPQTQKEWH